jgi:hypothetical protein
MKGYFDDGNVIVMFDEIVAVQTSEERNAKDGHIQIKLLALNCGITVVIRNNVVQFLEQYRAWLAQIDEQSLNGIDRELEKRIERVYQLRKAAEEGEDEPAKAERKYYPDVEDGSHVVNCPDGSQEDDERRERGWLRVISTMEKILLILIIL